jgi:hypothetical protein
MNIVDVMKHFRNLGYAVVLVSPEYLDGLDAGDAESAAWTEIDQRIEQHLINLDDEI